MLHDPSHKSTPEMSGEIKLDQKEIEVLRSLAREWAEISKLPDHKEKARLWQKLNDLESERPMVWINEIPWHEMNFNDELTLQCENSWARSQEDLIAENHLPVEAYAGDMIAESLAGLSPFDTQHRFWHYRGCGSGSNGSSSDIVSGISRSRSGIWMIWKRLRCPVITFNKEATETQISGDERNFWRHTSRSGNRGRHISGLLPGTT